MFNTLTFPDTMEEFIERYKVIKGEKNLYCDGVEFIPVFRMKEWVKRLQPRKGEWIKTYRNGFGNLIGYCNRCGRRYPVNNFCPNCGLRMEEGDSDEHNYKRY